MMFQKQSSGEISDKVKSRLPWVEYTSQIIALFKEDPDISVSLDDEANTISINVAKFKKAKAIKELFESKVYLGTKTFDVVVECNEKEPSVSASSVISDAFEGNPIFNGIETLQYSGMEVPYAVFSKKVIQYYNDNIQDIHGNKSCLAEDLARKLFKIKGILYCTSEN